ncbi:MAG: lytic transglycosylase domain-containing protein [Hyphomicrobiales bacterium]|nr:lytic transglycosylase domain-containing protein [Hyphomicrobiales bacterium]
MAPMIPTLLGPVLQGVANVGIGTLTPMRWAALLAVFILANGLAPVLAEDQAEPTGVEKPDVDQPVDDTPQTICGLIETAAATHKLPVGFFTRLIWQESRFRPDAVSPKGAQGIAQFMPGTAALRGLSDPFDPIEAIPASAHYLRDLADRFGNVGLAAAAYNAGENRVERWLGGSGWLPLETRDFVLRITGRTAAEWNETAPDVDRETDDEEQEDCLTLAALLAKPGAGSAIVSRIDKAGWAPWGAQVSGNFSLDRATASYARLRDRYATIIGDVAPMVIRDINRSRGRAPFFHLRVPAATRDEAAEMCKRLKAAGGACVVLKTGRR